MRNTTLLCAAFLTACGEASPPALTVGPVAYSEDQLLEVRNFGETTLIEVKQTLTRMGLHLGMRVPAASPS